MCICCHQYTVRWWKIRRLTPSTVLYGAQCDCCGADWEETVKE